MDLLIKDNTQEVFGGETMDEKTTADTVTYINENANIWKNLGIRLNEDGSVQKSNGVDPIFLLQRGEDGKERIVPLSESGIHAASKEFWQQAQLGRVLAT